MRLFKVLSFLLVVLVAFVFLPAIVLAAEDAAVAAIAFDWKHVVALLINSVLVILAVQILKPLLPTLPDWPKQLLALVAGPLLMWAQSLLTGWLGYPIDFGPLIELLTGVASALVAMGLFDVGKRAGFLKGSA